MGRQSNKLAKERNLCYKEATESSVNNNQSDQQIIHISGKMTLQDNEHDDLYTNLRDCIHQYSNDQAISLGESVDAKIMSKYVKWLVLHK